MQPSSSDASHQAWVPQAAKASHYLPDYVRSIRAENRVGLLRRWRLMQDRDLMDPRVSAQWFPGQRGLLEMLTVLSEEEVLRMAECNSPIFSVSLPAGLTPKTSASLFQRGVVEDENRKEIFMALVTRREAVIENPEQAAVQYDLSAVDLKVLSMHEPYELLDIAADPCLVMQPVASEQWFMVSALRDLTVARRTMYLGVSKRTVVSCFHN